jgi:hypothetical protein
MAIARLMKEFEYVLEAERELPVEKRTTWRLRPLNYATHREAMRTSLSLSDETQFIEVDGFGKAAKILNYALLGWTNFRNEDGVEMEFQRCADGTLPPQVLDLLVDVAVELSNAVTRHGAATKDHAKNSS